MPSQLWCLEYSFLYTCLVQISPPLPFIFSPYKIIIHSGSQLGHSNISSNFIYKYPNISFLVPHYSYQFILEKITRKKKWVSRII